MRHYNKLKRELREIYQQPRPHRWDAIASHFDRPPVSFQEFVKIMSRAAKGVADALKSLGEALAKQFGVSTDNIKLHRSLTDPKYTGFDRPGTSAHYVIERDGKITEKANPATLPWEIGIKTNQDGADAMAYALSTLESGKPLQPKHNIITGDTST